MVIEQLAIDPWKRDRVVFDLPDGYEVLRTALLPTGHYGLWVLYDGEAPRLARAVQVVACDETHHDVRFEFPNTHRFLGDIHPDGFNTCYYLFDTGEAAD